MIQKTDADYLNRCIEKIYQFIAFKQRTSGEVKARAIQYFKKIPKYKNLPQQQESLVRSVVDYFESTNYIDDEAYAIKYIQEKTSSSKPKSRLEIKQFLLKKHLPYDLIQNTIDEFYTNEIEERILKDLVESLKKKNKSKEQITRYLSQKGFSYHLIRLTL